MSENVDIEPKTTQDTNEVTVDDSKSVSVSGSGSDSDCQSDCQSDCDCDCENIQDQNKNDEEKDEEEDEEEDDESDSEPIDPTKLAEESMKTFSKVIKDFTKDILVTFPEYKDDLNLHLAEIIEKEEPDEYSVKAIYTHCTNVFPVKFFDILYQNETLFESDEELVFLPGIDFRNLWKENISDTTRDTIWRYLKLVLFTIVSGMNTSKSFGDTAKLFEAIDETSFKEKLEETISEMQESFDQFSKENDEECENDNENSDKTKSAFGTEALPNPKRTS